MICSEGYRRLQELDGKRRETMIYTGSVHRKITAPYVQCGVDSILRPALFVVFVSSGYVCRSCVCVFCRSAHLGTPALLYIVQERRES